MSMTPEIREVLRGLAGKLDAARHGEQTALVQEAAGFLGWSPQTVYRQLKQAVGWQSGRKPRADKGSTVVAEDALVMLGAVQREAIRDNGKQTLFTTTARGMLEQNGIELKVSNSQLNRLIRDRKLNVAAQRCADPVQALRAPHPNHTHEIDPSLCLVYYLKGRQHIMRDRDFYKNKLENFAKVKFKVWRYVLYDKASGVIVPWYCESAGENQHKLFEFLMFAWGEQPGRLFQGLPRFLLWDKGSANTSAAIKNLCRALGVETLEHQAGQARVKGGVEGANNIVETQFESRLRFEPVESIEQLNRAAIAWSRAWNANLIPGQDSRLRRTGLADAIARIDLWQLIQPQQLLLLPPVEVCKAFMTAKEETRKVRPDLTVSFKHPQAERTAAYSLRGLDGVNVGDEVRVNAMVFGDCAIQVTVSVYNGADRVYQVEPERGYDAYGQLLSAPIIGEAYKAMPQTTIEHAASAMDGQAYPGMSAEEVKAARAKKATPFDGALNTHSYLQDVELPAYLPRRGTEHALAAPAIEYPPLTLIEAAKQLKQRVTAAGGEWTQDRFQWLAQRYPAGVPEDQLAAIVAELTSPAAGTKTPLRVVKSA
ncbi:DDE-type integrase/transposase/recombinase [Chromobacterium subtsugae]|uniref:DDE-type integrase/transposase/recombinase n=1 Tax=Chromobacterium subtsugae TaxID=251747 RepID=A0ABS7FF56_9NEIS|nr:MULTISPECIES: DDE-type integrase/transposase/recombinase [Chromobacterium]KUM03506.1 integrase [Chromobacterium subtsugae]KZE87574.1 integrase [Chromobacterium sp. F49]MBW7567055.1 DDE-type integrase/transposase/recombinase [Chromobacterium subtsugae]MBW8288626.1 DDE-type integrase/transposase/recombinase [Chromobacterium subtsugae]WSE90147.1 DDE-type integrase/transposase/recombinase [Chromobacterium subtsugae]